MQFTEKIVISRLLPYTNKKGETNAGCVPVDSDFYTEMYDIKSGKYRGIVEETRAIKNKGDRSAFKQSKLPSLSISGRFRKWRSTENLVQHSGLLNIDIDSDTNLHIQDWSALRDDISKIQFVVACWLSVSSRGVTLVIRIKPNRHKETFYYMADYFEQIWDIRIDRGCNDVTRQRYTSYDPDIFINDYFETIPIVEPTEQWLTRKSSEDAPPVFTIVGEPDAEINFLNAVRYVENSRSAFVFEEGSKYFFLRGVAAHCNIFGMSEHVCEQLVFTHFADKTDIKNDALQKPIKDIYKAYKSQHGTYEVSIKKQRREIKLRWALIQSFLHAGAHPTSAQLEVLAAEHDINLPIVEWISKAAFQELATEFGFDNFHTFKKAIVLLARKWIIRKNIISERLEMRLIGSSRWEQVNINTFFCYLVGEKWQKIKKEELKAILDSDHIEQFNPFVDYFNSITHDETEDWITKLAAHITVRENQEFWQTQFKKALVRSIACALGEDVNRILMVLYGAKQATGKTTFIRSRCPWDGKQYYTESPISGTPKDVAIRLSENFIYNLEELEGLHKQEVSAFKAMISQATIKERRSYATYEETRRRRCNFWASTNDKSILHDTENTRWLIFEITVINWDYKKHIDIKKVWAQAYYLYKSGFEYALTAEETLLQAKSNEGYRHVKAEEELIALHFSLPSKDNKGQFFTSTQIVHELSRVYKKINIYPAYIGRAVKKVLGIESIVNKVNGVVHRGYWLISSVPASSDN